MTRTCKVVVLTGAGDAYSAGMDLREFFRASDDLTPEKRAAFGRVLRRGSGAGCASS